MSSENVKTLAVTSKKLYERLIASGGIVHCIEKNRKYPDSLVYFIVETPKIKTLFQEYVNRRKEINDKKRKGRVPVLSEPLENVAHA